MRVRFRRRALLDIKAIHQYIADRNEPTAARIVAQIRHDCQRLGMWPHLGHSGRAKGTFEWIVAGLPYVIVYEEARNEVAIVAVFHCAQDR